MSMYEDAKSVVNISGTTSDAFSITVVVHQGSVLSPLLFIIVLEALPSEIRSGLHWELLHAYDLVSMADSIEELVDR